jgi:hypothetical protein
MKQIIQFRFGLIILTGFLLSSCSKYVEAPLSPGTLGTSQEYASDASATGAVLALYSYYFSTGFMPTIAYTGGLLSDELQSTTGTAETTEFMQDLVTNTNSSVETYLWTYAYGMVGEADLAIDGISKSGNVTPATKNQLIGEAKFFRAFVFFNMVNYFGGVPLSTDAAQLNNAFLPRASTDSVWAQIKADLIDAENLLPVAYAGTAGQKARVNKWAAAALLARAYLYLKDYPNAEAQATLVIGSGTYSLPALSNVFVNTSPETIFQIANLYGYTQFGADYRGSVPTATSIPPSYVLYPGFTASFEPADKRDTAWVDSTVYNMTTYYRIKKYQLGTATAGNEYNIVLRLAEQYLIRAEARAQQDNTSGAQADMDSVRVRAGLPLTTAANKTDLMAAIAHERKVELFGEYGHRWFDLKRTNQADAVLGPLKPTWKGTAVLLPIPYNQIILNSNLIQNPGYN